MFHTDHPSIRLYTTILSQADVNINFRKQLYNFIGDGVKINLLDNEFNAPSLYSSILPFVVKVYPRKGAFSGYLAALPEGTNKFTISGPYVTSIIIY